MFTDVVRVLIPAGTAFVIGVGLTPVLTHYLYKYKAWKKQSGKIAYDGSDASEFNRLHTHHEVRAPRMGGIIVWASTVLAVGGFALFAAIFPGPVTDSLNFFSRGQTWMPLAAP